MNESLLLTSTLQPYTLPYNITCGYFDCSEFGTLKESPSREATRFEIEYYLENASITTVDNVDYSIKADHILIAKPGQIRYSKLPFYTMWIKFSVDGLLAERLNKSPIYFPAINSPRIKPLMEKLILLYDEPNKELSFYSLLMELLELMLNDALLTAVPLPFNINVVEKAQKYIDANFQNPITLNDIAATVSLSPNHFHSIFKSTCGVSPHKYLLSKRITASKEMLWITEQTIPEIAEKCGFGCQQYFTKVFKQETGITPGAYRKNLQKRYFLYD